MTTNLVVAKLQGASMRWGSRGALLHVVPEIRTVEERGSAKALCGAKPGWVSLGWSVQDAATAPTCRRCISRQVKS